jgi:hypothetical protein
MTYFCIGAWHKNDGTIATHQAATMVWPKTLEPALRDAPSAQVQPVNSMLLCLACQRMLTDPKPDPKATELQRQMNPMLPTGDDRAMDYEHARWCFLSIQDDFTASTTGPPPPADETNSDEAREVR